MNPTDLLDRLRDAGVLVTDGDDVRLSEPFEETMATYRERVEDGNAAETLRDAARADLDEPRMSTLVRAAEEEEDVAAQYLALEDHTDEPVYGTFVTAANLLDWLDRGPPESDGAPDQFMSIHADRLPAFLALARNAIVFIWRDDCAPCEMVRSDFEDLFDHPPDDIALLGVYGPENPQLLRERYDVGGGPTTLFVRDAEVDCRLVAAQPRQTLEAEVDTLQDLVAN